MSAPDRPPRRMSAREVATVIGVMALFVAAGVGVILRSGEAAAVALGLGVVVALAALVAVTVRDRAGIHTAEENR